MEWNSTYSVGVDHIDKQHRNLFNLVNDLHEAIGQPNTIELISGTMVELVNYSKVHFADEERYMQDIGYPDLNNHMKLHKKFNEEIILMLNKLRNNNPLPLRQLYAFLQSWLIQHIKIEDKKIGKYDQMRKIGNMSKIVV